MKLSNYSRNILNKQIIFQKFEFFARLGFLIKNIQFSEEFRVAAKKRHD